VCGKYPLQAAPGPIRWFVWLTQRDDATLAMIEAQCVLDLLTI
jgi:hypothetical protein